MTGMNWKDALRFSRSETRGIIALTLICAASACYSYFVPGYVSRREIAKFENELAVFPLSGSEKSIALEQEAIVSLPVDTLSRMEPASINKEKTTIVNLPVIAKVVQQADQTIRINSDDARDIIRTGLVPPKIAFRLVRFREDAGGFHSVRQLLDIYEMTDSLYHSLLDNVIFEEIELSVVNVNSASREELEKHPYISRGLASQMVNFREKVKPFGSAEDLLRLYFMDEDLLEKFKPYVSFY